ncbi:MAG: type II secretion system F family protein [Pseudomonadota bacterium]
MTRRFTWRGKNAQGQEITGELEGTSMAMVQAILRRQNITPLTIKPTRYRLRLTRHRVTSKDITIFARQLAAMLNAGVPLVQSLQMIADSGDNPAMQHLLLNIKQDLSKGTTLFSALRRYPKQFDELFCHLVQAGEQGGVLETLLDKLATHQEQIESLKAKIGKAMYYPLTVLIVALMITGLIMIFVVPQFQSLFSSFGADLPVFTQWITALSDFIGRYWWLIVLTLALLSTLIIAIWHRSATLRARMEKLLFALPVIGKTRHKAVLARFSRTTAILFAAGIPLTDTLTAVAGATGNSLYHKAVLDIRDQVATGQSLHQILQQHALFPPLITQMVAIGEESGSLDTMLNKAADFYEEAVDHTINSLSNLLEPVIMVFLGVVIGGLVIALYLPIFQLGSVISGY